MSQGLLAGQAYSIYRLDLRGFDQDVARIKRELDALYRQSRQPLPAPRLPSPSGGGGGGGGSQPGDDSARLQRQADASLRLAQARARLAQIEGDEAGALKILNSALGENTSASQRAQLAVQTQTARIHAATTSIQGNAGAFRQFGDAAKSGLLGIVGPAALATASIAALKGIADSFVGAFHLKTQIDASTNSINLQLRGVRDMGVAWAQGQAVAERYKLTQGELTGIMQNSVQVLRQSRSGADDLITTLLRLQSTAPEKPIEEAARALRELQSGDTTTIKELFNISAGNANRMKAEILAGADAVQVLSRFLASSGAGMEVLEARTKGAVGAMNDLKVAQERLALAQAKFAEGPGLAILEARVDATTRATQLLSADTQLANNNVRDLWLMFGASAESATNAGTSYQGFVDALLRGVGATQSAIPLTFEQAKASAAQALAAQQAAAGSIYQSQAMIGAANAAQQARDAQAQYVQTLENDATQSLITQANTQTLAIAKQNLDIQARGAAASLLANGQAGAEAAARFAASASLVDQATAAYYRLMVAQAAAAQFNADIAVPVADSIKAPFQQQIENTKAYVEAQQKAHAVALAAAKAQRDQNFALGNSATKIALLKKELGGLVPGTEAYIRKQTELLQLQEQGGRKKGGGGGVKLSDQEQLNNKLLKNEDQYQAKAEDAERKHLDNLLKIERDHAQRSLEQQRANEVSKRQSRYSFYASLANASKDLGESEAQSYSAAYEQAFAESQALAQDGQHKLAAERLSLRQQQIQQDIEAAKAITEAEREGDTRRAESLRQLEELRKDAQREELKDLEGRGDDLVNDRQKAIDEEQKRFADANEQNALAAGRKADAVVAGAEREKKAIGDVNELLAKQNALYGNRGAGAAPGAAPTAVVTPPIASAPAAAPTVAPSAGDAARLMAVADAALLSAVEAQTQMQVGKFDTLIGAVQSVERRVGAVESAVKSIPRNVN